MSGCENALLYGWIEIEGYDQELDMYANVAFLAAINTSLLITAIPVYLITPILSAALYLIPDMIKTTSVRHPNYWDGKGVPFYYYYERAHEIRFAPWHWPVFLVEGIIDYLHAYSYLFIYWKSFMTTDENTLPGMKGITYTDRPGRYVANDLMELLGWMYPI